MPESPYGDNMSNLISDVIRYAHEGLEEIDQTTSRETNGIGWAKLVIKLSVLFGKILAASLEAERIRKEASPRSQAALEREAKKREQGDES